MTKIIICKRCKRERKHCAKGLCASCYTRVKQLSQGDDWLKHHAEAERKRRERLGDEYRKRERERNKSPKRMAWKKQYYESKNGKQANRKGSKRDRRIHPQRNRARQAIRAKWRFGKIPHARELKCDHCNKQAQEYHHHKGHEEEFKLDVIPLCKPCHVKADHLHITASSLKFS